MSIPNNLRSLYSKLNVLYRTLGRLNAGKRGGWSNTASLPDILEYLRMIYAVGSAVLDMEENLPRSLQGHIESSVERTLIEIEDFLDENGTSDIRKLRGFITNDVHPVMDECESGLAWLLSDIERGSNTEGKTMDIETLSNHLSIAGVEHVVVTSKSASPKKWIQKVTKSMEKKGTEGALHRYFKIPEDETIPLSLMRAAMKDPKTSEKTRKRIQFALNMRKINTGK